MAILDALVNLYARVAATARATVTTGTRAVLTPLVRLAATAVSIFAVLSLISPAAPLFVAMITPFGI